MSGTDQTASALFRAGRLDEAVAAAQAVLRKAPTDLNARVLLGELLAFTGNLERADVVLDAASAIDPTTAMVVAEFRQLIRADMARRQLFRDGRVPEFLADPTETQRLQLAALVALRAGDLAEASRQAEAAEAVRPRDLLWRRASMTVADGPDGEVYLPAIYAADDATTDALRLGHETDWRETEGGPVRGVGQRLLIVGEDAVAMMELGSFRFDIA